MADQKAPTPAEITIMVSGAVALVFSFFDFYKPASAWSSFGFPIATLPAIFAAIMAAQIVLTKYANVSMPDRVLGFTWPQLHCILGFYAAVNMVAWLINETSNTGVGFWFMLAGSIGALVGAIMLSKERAGTGPGGPTA